MFSGIVESVQPILHVEDGSNVIRLQIQRPPEFDDIKVGDSIAVNGICLTIEKFDSQTMAFALGAETLRLLHLTAKNLAGRRVNLERSLRFGDRIHGHLVTGHVDSLGEIARSERFGESWFLDVDVNSALMPYLWKKGSVTLHGVSLTVNEVKDRRLSVCLIPETIQRTNLTDLKVGDAIHVEPDYFAKAFLQHFSNRAGAAKEQLREL